MRRVVIVQPYVPSYRVPLFEGLRERLLADGVDLSIVAGTPKGEQAARNDSAKLSFQRPVRSFEMRFRGRSLRLKPAMSATRGADLVISELASGALETYGFQLRRRQKSAVWGHGYAAASAPSDLDTRLERWIMRRADRVFVYTDAGHAAAVTAGVEPPLITVLNNTVDTTALHTAIETISEKDVEKFREAHDLGTGPICMFIGGLDAPKRVEFLLRTGEALAARIPGFRLVICGDGEQKSIVNRFRSSPWLRYLGRVSVREKALLARCGSLILNPGRVGLIAPESLAMGTPIATTAWPYHAPEFSYLVDGVNALITVDSLAGYITGVSDLLGDPAALDRLRDGCAAAAHSYSLESMVERFAAGILDTLGPAPAEPESRRLALFVWGNWSPNHHARLRSAIELFEENGVRAEGLELFGSSGVYQWGGVESDLPVHRLAFPPPEMRFRPWLLTTRALPFLWATRPDVIFVPSYWPWSLYLNLTARAFGARVVMMNDTHAGSARSGGLRLRARKLFVRNFHAALVAGEPQVEYFSSLGLSAHKIFTGYDVVDNDFFADGAKRARQDAAAIRDRLLLPMRYLLSLGRLVPEKNLDVLLKAFALVKPGSDGVCPALVIVGSGPEERRIREMCQALGLRVDTNQRLERSVGDSGALTTSVHFYPFATPEEVANYYGLAEALVLPSASETWGLVVNEAMASSLPVVVSSAVGCSADLVQIGANGFIFDPESPSELAQYLQRFIDAPSLSQQMGGVSAEIIQHWGLGRFAAGALSAFRVAIGGK